MSALLEEATNDSLNEAKTATVVVTAALSESGGMKLTMDETQLYLDVPIGDVLTITYTLEAADGQNVVFDNPPITVSNSSAPGICRRNETVAQMTIDNTSWQTQGASFYYTIHAIWITATGGRIPIRLDPTVHNDPPS